MATSPTSALSHTSRSSFLDPDDEVKQAAITSLGEIGGSQAKAALLLLLESESEATRESASDALAALDFEEDPLAFKHRI